MQPMKWPLDFYNQPSEFRLAIGPRITSLLDKVHAVERLLLLVPELGHKVDPDHLREPLGHRRLLVFGPEKSVKEAARVSYGEGCWQGCKISDNETFEVGAVRFSYQSVFLYRPEIMECCFWAR